MEGRKEGRGELCPSPEESLFSLKPAGLRSLVHLDISVSHTKNSKSGVQGDGGPRPVLSRSRALCARPCSRLSGWISGPEQDPPLQTVLQPRNQQTAQNWSEMIFLAPARHQIGSSSQLAFLKCLLCDRFHCRRLSRLIHLKRCEVRAVITPKSPLHRRLSSSVQRSLNTVPQLVSGRCWICAQVASFPNLSSKHWMDRPPSGIVPSYRQHKWTLLN